MIKYALVLLLPFISSIPCLAELTLPTVFSDHMVLQRERSVPVWGKADPRKSVTVEFAGQTRTTTAGVDGTWRVDLEPLTTSVAPRILTVRSGDQQIEFEDVLVGEVWLCSGQSNMQWFMQHTENAVAAMPLANHAGIRLYDTPRIAAEAPQEKINATWTACTTETIKTFSGVAYYFGLKLHEDLDVPIGLLLSCRGGSRIEPWTPPCGFEGIESLTNIHQQVQKTLPSSSVYKKAMAGYQANITHWVAESRKAMQTDSYISAPPEFPADLILTGDHQTPTKAYNGMLHAHIPFAIRGAIWYQGESNRAEGQLYVDKTRALLNGWYKLWGYHFPFYFVQIAPYQYGSEKADMLPLFWEAQSEIVKTIPLTGMTVVSDRTMLEDIHPRNKEIPGTRLALLAEANCYGMDVVSTGPVFQTLEKHGQALKIIFDSAEGLTTRDGKAPDWFEVAGKDGPFKKAEAKIVGHTIAVRSAEVAEPVAVRFAWHKIAVPNLMNGAGLPASAFRAGDLPKPENSIVARVPEATGFRVIYQLEIPVRANYAKGLPQYSIDSSAQDVAPFSKIAYFLELEKTDGTKQYAFASMDRFTEKLSQTGVPVNATGARLMQKVSNLTVRSNVAGITSCTDSDGGNIEFWPGNYSAGNAKNIPGATDLFDFGDTASGQSPGYGCMQVHNWKEKQTVLAFNNWGGGSAAPADIGMGNSTGKTRDWTFTSNAGEYSLRRLTVMVK